MSVINLITGLIRSVVEPTPDLNKVVEVRPDRYTHWPVRCRDECLRVFGPEAERSSGDALLYHLVVMRAQTGRSADRAFLLRQSSDCDRLLELMQRLCSVLPPLLDHWPRDTLTVPVLQRITDGLQQHAHWTLAHTAANLGWLAPFQQHVVEVPRHDPPDACQSTPLHVAVSGGYVRLVRHLLVQLPAASVGARDDDGNTVLHVAAAHGSRELLTAVVERADGDTLSARNRLHMTPLHVACMQDRPDNVRVLVLAGADVNAAVWQRDCSGSLRQTETDSVSARDAFEAFPRQVNVSEMKRGGTPLHWACAADIMTALLELGCLTEAVNFDGETPLHVMAREQLVNNVLLLLSHGSVVDAVDGAGNTPLLLAAARGALQEARACLVFGADVRHRNSVGDTALHLAARSPSDPQQLVRTLLAVGSPLCAPRTATCTHLCAGDVDECDRLPDDSSSHVQRRCRSNFDEVLSVATMSHSVCAGGAASERQRCRLLCLDGGGVKGLVLLQQLLALEQLVTGRELLECFDWVAGTSIGGVIALALARGQSLRYCQRLLFRMKDKVFVGSRPYSDEALERMFKQVFGETAVMADIARPQMMITAVLADRHPSDLHLFRNYQDAASMLNIEHNSEFQAPAGPSEQLLWKVARATSAAPTYFSASGRFLDGGIIANNPTLDALTEIFEHQLALRTLGRVREVQPPSAVLSLGCGRPPVVKTNSTDFQWTSIWDVTKFGSSVSSLIQLVIDQVTSVENRVVDRARAWCASLSVPYLRCSPQLSVDLQLDSAANDQLLLVLWQTMAEMHAQRHVLAEFSQLL